jgi:site-specific DNA recombinase
MPLAEFSYIDSAWEDGKVVATFRQPFDMLAETATVAPRMAVGESAISTRSEIWLGDLDSNQDCSVQSREFYR